MPKSAKAARRRPADDKKSGVKRVKAAEAAPVITGPLAVPAKTDVAREPELDEAAAEAKPGRRASKIPLSEIHPTLLHLGQTVRRSRKAKGLTQMQLAQRCGFNSAAIFMVEAGRQNMTIKSLMAIAAALELEVGDLFPRTTPRTSAKLTEVADTIGDVKGRVVMQLQMLDRLAGELREEAGIVG